MHPEHTPLTRAVTALLGDPRPVTGVQRLRNATKKGVHRLTRADGTTVITYLWNETENYRPSTGAPEDPADPFSHSSAPDLFAASHRTLPTWAYASPTCSPWTPPTPTTPAPSPSSRTYPAPPWKS